MGIPRNTPVILYIIWTCVYVCSELYVKCASKASFPCRHCISSCKNGQITQRFSLYSRSLHWRWIKVMLIISSYCIYKTVWYVWIMCPWLSRSLAFWKSENNTQPQLVNQEMPIYYSYTHQTPKTWWSDAVSRCPPNTGRGTHSLIHRHTDRLPVLGEVRLLE